jgi:hypothetical protein
MIQWLGELKIIAIKALKLVELNLKGILTKMNLLVVVIIKKLTSKII